MTGRTLKYYEGYKSKGRIKIITDGAKNVITTLRWTQKVKQQVYADNYVCVLLSSVVEGVRVGRGEERTLQIDFRVII